MKLLLDENVSDRIVQRIVDLFPDSAHLKTIGLKEADDSVVWAWAQQHGFTIVSKDTDFYQRAIVYGHPPKLIWLRVGKCPTSLITAVVISGFSFVFGVSRRLYKHKQVYRRTRASSQPPITLLFCP